MYHELPEKCASQQASFRQGFRVSSRHVARVLIIPGEGKEEEEEGRERNR